MPAAGFLNRHEPQPANSSAGPSPKNHAFAYMRHIVVMATNNATRQASFPTAAFARRGQVLIAHFQAQISSEASFPLRYAAV